MIRFSVQVSCKETQIFTYSKLEWNQSGKTQSVQMVENGLSCAAESKPLKQCGLKQYVIANIFLDVRFIIDLASASCLA
jgi:hypothetical protein